jgi:c-di-GMP-binding flagellar brake protein YcgR
MVNSVNMKAIFKTGDRVTIRDGRREYNTSVDDVVDEWSFSLLQPFDKGIPVDLEPGKEYQITCVKSGGLHQFMAIAMHSDMSGRVKVNYFRYTGEYIRLQRRNAFRFRMRLDVEVRRPTVGKVQEEVSEDNTDWTRTNTVDVSETGMRVRMSSRFHVGDPVECILKIDKYGVDAILPPITGRVVRTTVLPGRKDEVLCGVQFKEIDEKSRSILLKLVTLGQRNKIST